MSLRGGEERFAGQSTPSFTTADTGAAQINARQLLFDGGKTRMLLREQQSDLQETEANLLALRQDLALELAVAYVDIIKYRRLIQFAEENIRNHRSALSKTQMKHRNGASPRADVDLVKARLAMAEASLRGRQRQLGFAENTFAKLTGYAPSELQEPEFPDWALPQSLDEVDLSRNPSIIAAYRSIETSHSRWKGTRSSLAPRLEFLATGDLRESARFSNRQEDTSALVVASYDLFGGGRRKANISQAANQLERARMQAESTQLDAQEDFYNAWTDLISSEERIFQLETYRSALSSVVSAYQRQFEIGQRALLNVLDIENELFSAKSSYEEERLNRIQAAYRVLAANGDLIETLL